MQSKVALKLLFKTLPKTDNDSLLKVLELDNRFDYEKNTRIRANEEGYEVFEEERKISALDEANIPAIEVQQSKEHLDLFNAATSK
jgi:hypothetical protein